MMHSHRNLDSRQPQLWNSHPRLAQAKPIFDRAWETMTEAINLLRPSKAPEVSGPPTNRDEYEEAGWLIGQWWIGFNITEKNKLYLTWWNAGAEKGEPQGYYLHKGGALTACLPEYQDEDGMFYCPDDLDGWPVEVLDGGQTKASAEA